MPVIAGCGSNDTRTALWHMQVAQGPRRRRRADGRAVLQPPEPGRADRALLVPRREQRPADRALQRARAHGDRHAARDGDRAGAALPRADRRDQGRERRPAARRHAPRRRRARTSASSRATTRWRSPAMRSARSAASRSPPTSRRSCAPSSTQRRRPATTRRRASSTTACSRCTRRCSPTPAPSPTKYALAKLHDWLTAETRLPIAPCSEAARKAVDAALEGLG